MQKGVYSVRAEEREREREREKKMRERERERDMRIETLSHLTDPQIICSGP